jgi:hypothetical protein
VIRSTAELLDLLEVSAPSAAPLVRPKPVTESQPSQPREWARILGEVPGRRPQDDAEQDNHDNGRGQPKGEPSTQRLTRSGASSSRPNPVRGRRTGDASHESPSSAATDGAAADPRERKLPLPERGGIHLGASSGSSGIVRRHPNGTNGGLSNR